MKRVSIQGIKGSFHEQAANRYFQEEISISEQSCFEDVIEVVQNGECDMGVMAIENTVSGTIHDNFELIKNSNLSIVGEIYLRIVQNLAVNKGVMLTSLKHVESHYMAIDQCRKFFKPYPQIKLVNAVDTASSMRKVAENNLKFSGAIGSALAAEYYNLEIIAHGIESNKKNYTRFLILENKLPFLENCNKSSIQFVLNNRVGGLAEALNVIKKNHINLCKIESLPIVGEPWHYQFYLDMVYDDISNYLIMIEKLQPQVEHITILGNYKNQNTMMGWV